MPFSTRVAGWLRLLRAPNLLTVPGDVLAGCLAGAAVQPDTSFALWITIAASLCLYGAGLILNDVKDVEEDRAQRPGRPLAAGTIEVRTAMGVSIKLMATALVLTALAGTKTFIAGAALCLAILLYTLKLKSHTWAGPLMMGLCRALNVGLGVSLANASAPGSRAGWIAAGFIGLYIAAVSIPAKEETHPDRARRKLWIPPVLLLAGLAAGGSFFLQSPVVQRGLAGTAYALAVVLAFTAAWRGGRAPDRPSPSVPGAIGLMISGIIFLQAAFVWTSADREFALAAGAAVACLWPMNRLLAKWFYTS